MFNGVPLYYQVLERYIAESAQMPRVAFEAYALVGMSLTDPGRLGLRRSTAFRTFEEQEAPQGALICLGTNELPRVQRGKTGGREVGKELRDLLTHRHLRGKPSLIVGPLSKQPGHVNARNLLRSVYNEVA